MRWTRTLQTVDVHCAGEIGRVVSGGLLDIPGDTIAAKLAHINQRDDRLRQLLTSEPRSASAGSFVLLPPACRAEADCGFIVLQPDQAHAMSGSNAMCAVTALLETGMLAMTEPQTTVTLDTAAGLVRAQAECRDGKVERVSLEMPPAFVVAQDARIDTPQWGELRYDLCFGGVFYALVDVQQLGLRIAPEQARELAECGVELRRQIAAQTEIAHPLAPQINGIAYLMFRADEPDGAVRTCTAMPPGRVDRSPCGTGSSANLAARHARGLLRPGDRLLSRSTIGGEFVTECIEEVEIGPYRGVRNRVSGQCWIWGLSQLGLDPADPFPRGFRLADTWGAIDGL